MMEKVEAKCIWVNDIPRKEVAECPVCSYENCYPYPIKNGVVGNDLELKSGDTCEHFLGLELGGEYVGFMFA